MPCVSAVVLAAGAMMAVVLVSGASIKVDVTAEDIDRALAIARRTESERGRFHAPYLVTPDSPWIERAELVTEFRRVVLLAEERGRAGDRMFGYSVTRAQQALAPWRRRLSLLLRLRFHPQNTYVGVPHVEVLLHGGEQALIGVLKEPILAMPSSAPGERMTILGAVVEGVFDVGALGGDAAEFIVRVDGAEVARIKVDLTSVE
jgi:hypothetical protein